ncbi:hypothetical protein SAM9427_35865 [Streptomyces sp. ETH9427]|uniref:hypothetical protein n=1 Tax=Streptomyces sp. E1N211 TaxID=1851876 RepID=UPI000E0AF8D4|nr:hypothetical protein [Streptomyces sp. E1N211]AXI84591.1 hypothetical protein SAM9427_00230 [Streptomyces sp. ETH9427]AXI90494.1 hypothetical protein SAM9427_35865 [Streptomyces sp. ETH9427]
MHVVIAWREQHRNGTQSHTGTTRQVMPSTSFAPRQGATALTADIPGLRSGRWITDPAANLQGLALIWDSAADADFNLPNVCARTFGCAPSHRWTFELPGTPPQDNLQSLPDELNVLLHA